MAGTSRDAVLVVAPDHARLFREAGWSRSQVISALGERLGRCCQDGLAGQRAVSR
jgi:hypothetical protein